MSLKFFNKTLDITALIWVMLCTLALARFASISSNRTFQYDEWNFVLNRWQLSLDTFLQPHNSHLSIFPAAVFFVLLRAIGLANYSVFLLVGFFTHIATASIFALLVSKRLGKTCAIALGALFLFLGTGAENILWPFQIGAMASLLGYLLAIYFLEITHRYSNLLTMISIILSIGSAGFGIAAVIGVTIQIVTSRQFKKSWWVTVVPSALWLLWYLNYGQSEVEFDRLNVTLRYINESFAASLNSIFALSLGWGFVFEIVLLAALTYFFVVKKTFSPRLVGLVIVLIVNWFFTALSRAQFWAPQSSRYVYFTIPLILLVLVEITKKLPRQQLNLAAVIIAIWSITATWSFMNAHANFLRDWSASLRAELSALEDHKQFADPNYFPDTLRAPDISVKKYFAATAALESSPAQEFSSLSTTSNSVRTEVDRVLLQSGALVVGELSQSNKGCSPELDASDYLVLNKSSVFISSPDGEIEIGFRRFADEPNSALRTVIAEGAQVSITTQKMSDVNFWTVVSLTPNKRVCVSLSSD
jgi:hypothetical protein